MANGFLRWKTGLFSCRRRSWRISWPNDGTTVQGRLEARRETREARRRRRGGARPCGRYDLWTFGGWKGGSSRLWRASRRLLVCGRGWMAPRGVARSSQGFLDWWRTEIRRAPECRPRRSNAPTRWRSCARMAVMRRGWGGRKVERRACRSEGRRRRKWTFGGEFARCSSGIGARIRPPTRGGNRATTVNRRVDPAGGGGTFKCAPVPRWSWNLVGEVTDAKPNLWWCQTLPIHLARCQRWDVKRRIWPCCSQIVSFEEGDRATFLWILASSFKLYFLGKISFDGNFGVVWLPTSEILFSFTAFDWLFDNCFRWSLLDSKIKRIWKRWIRLISRIFYCK